MKYVKPKIIIINSPNINQIIFSSIICYQKIQKDHLKNPKKYLDELHKEIKRKHYSVLEYGNLDLLFQNISNWDMLYLSSYKYISIMKSSFRRVEHNSVAINNLINKYSKFKKIDLYLKKLYLNLETLKNLDSEKENFLPMCSTNDYLVSLNIREFLHIISNKDKLPSSLKFSLNKILAKLPKDIKNLVDFTLINYSDKNYLKDRMFSLKKKQFRNKKEGLIYDNYNEVSSENSFFIFKKNISFKLLSQIIRERSLKIHLNLENINFKNLTTELKIENSTKEIFEELLKIKDIKNSYLILPFGTEVESFIKISTYNLENGFFNKLKGNKSMRNFANFIKNSISEKYPEIIKK